MNDLRNDFPIFKFRIHRLSILIMQPPRKSHRQLLMPWLMCMHGITQM